MQKTVSLIALAAAVCFVGCSKERESKPAMTPASGTETVEREWSEEPSSMPQDDPHTGMPEPHTGRSGSMEHGTKGKKHRSQESSGSAREYAATLAATRCRREFRCDQIGSDKKYPTMEMCQASMLADANKELAKCPKGLDREKVQECASAIDTTGCDTPGDNLTEYQECRTVSLCL